MSTIHLKIITPKKIVREEDVHAVTLPSAEGEMTILPRHTNLFALLNEGIIRIKTDEDEDFLAIGGGYMETDGKQLNILVSRAYGQNEIDANLIQQAVDNAKKILAQSAEKSDREQASTLLRRSLIDMKLLRKRRRKA